MIDHYDWPGGREAVLRFGPVDGPVVVAALPLFEEANRTRSFVVTLLRALAELGFASALPDLPGQGESEKPLQDTTLSIWNTAFSSVVQNLDAPAHILSVRSGALVTGTAAARSRWRFAPCDGPTLVRELSRTASAAAREGGAPFDPAAIDEPGPPLTIAGTALPRPLLRDLRSARPDDTGPIRTVRLESDPAPADRTVPGAPLWRWAEPGNDPALATLLADDITRWVRQCES